MSRTKTKAKPNKRNEEVFSAPEDEDDANVQWLNLLSAFFRIEDPEIRDLAIMLIREVAEAAEKLGPGKLH